jgi:hypothetical protein
MATTDIDGLMREALRRIAEDHRDPAADQNVKRPDDAGRQARFDQVAREVGAGG